MFALWVVVVVFFSFCNLIKKMLLLCQVVEGVVFDWYLPFLILLSFLRLFSYVILNLFGPLSCYSSSASKCSFEIECETESAFLYPLSWE